jgi:protein ImuB
VVQRAGTAVPHLRLGRADAARDAQLLTSVAHVALAFTPSVCLAPPSMASGAGSAAAVSAAGGASHTVLLQVQASLRCFGGQPALMQRLRAALLPLGCTVRLASAPTAQGASLLARLVDGNGDEFHCTDLHSLQRQLDAAPVQLLGLSREQAEALADMGLSTLGALRRLPGLGLRHRFGAGLLDALARVSGERPDPPPAWLTLPDVFEARLELQARADTTDQVLHGAQLLITPLLAWSRAQQARVRSFTLFMHHEPRHRQHTGTPPVSELTIASAEPSCDVAHLSVLLRERLAHLSLPAPTLALRLRCADVVRGSSCSAELFTSARGEREGLVRLIERLQARLGPQQVQRLLPAAGHRAGHRAGRHAAPVRPVAQAASAPRPVWLLDEPQPLPERQSRPLLDGQPLQLLCGPERVESGWWSTPRTERDYFIAQTPAGALVWICRARLPLSVAESASGWLVCGWFA